MSSLDFFFGNLLAHTIKVLLNKKKNNFKAAPKLEKQYIWYQKCTSNTVNYSDVFALKTNADFKRESIISHVAKYHVKEQ